MEPSCNGCGVRLGGLDSYYMLELHIKSDGYESRPQPGPAFCKICMNKMQYLLQKDRYMSMTEEEG